MQLSPLLLLMANAAEEKQPPVIDIDGTLIIQFVLFLVAYLVLKNLLFTPYLKMRRDRTAGIDGVRQKAAEMEARARDISADYDRRIKEVRSRSDEERLRLRGEGLDRERVLLGEARGIAQKHQVEIHAQIAAQTQAATADLQRQAEPLARQIASKILGREV